MKIILLLVTSTLFLTNLLAQREHKIDQLFKDWRADNHPGGAVLIISGNDTVYAKAFGMANTQHNIPNSLTSVFNIGSVSKQFTALGIALLCEEGMISAEDSIQKYLPELPDFGYKITIRNLLHHTSGLRSTPELFGLAGWRDGDVITTTDDFNYLCKQTDLNFEPGTEYMYSNSNYVLLAIIISRITKQNFSQWMHENIFKPLKMTDTYVDETNENLIPKTTTPYIEVEENYFVIAKNSSLDIGASNVYSSALDLSKWLAQLQSPEKKWEKAMHFLKTTDTLKNGVVNEYASGLIIDEYLGNKRIYHTGGVPGYLSFAMCFPEEKLSLVVLTNYLDFKAYERIEKLLYQLLKDKSQKNNPSEKIKTVPLNIKNAEAYCADFWNTRNNYSRRVYLENDTLWYHRANGSRSQLLQLEDSLFIIGGINAIVKVRFTKQNNKICMLVQDGEQPEAFFEEYNSSSSDGLSLANYTGAFYSPELETTYKISLKNEKLTGYHSRHGQFDIAVLRQGVVSWSGVAVAKYEMNKEGKILGCYVTTDRLRNVWFVKL